MYLPAIRAVVLVLAITPAAVMQASAAPQNQQEPAKPPDDAAVDGVSVTTASRFLEKLINAPATMTVLTAEVIGREVAGVDHW